MECGRPLWIGDTTRLKQVSTSSHEEKRPQFSKMSSFGMIVIHVGILIYPVKDSAEMGNVFSKYKFFFPHFILFGIPNKVLGGKKIKNPKYVNNYWYFVAPYLTK